MAERQLKIDVIVEADGSITKLKTLDDAMTRLSDRSLAKVSAGVSTVDKELASLQKSIDRTVESTKRQDQQTNSLVSTLGKLVGTAALIGAVKGTLAYADALDDAAKQTNINVREYQKLTFAATQNNVAMNQLTGAIGIMQDRLAGGDKSAVAALNKLNLSWKELKTLSPDKQLLAISDSLQRVTSHEEKITTLNDLFGRQGRELLPLLTSNMRELMQAADDTGQVMDEELVKALAEANDTVDQLKTAGMVLIGQFLRPVLPLFQFWAQSATAVASGLRTIMSSEIFTEAGQRKLNSLADKINPIAWLIGKGTGVKLSELSGSGTTTGFEGPSVGSPGVATNPGFLNEFNLDQAAKDLNQQLRETNKLTNNSARDAEKMRREFQRTVEEIRKFESAMPNGRATPFGTPVDGWEAWMENPALNAMIEWDRMMREQGNRANAGTPSKFIGSIPVGIELDLDAAMAREMAGIEEAGVEIGSTFGQRFSESFGDVLRSAIPDLIADLFRGGPHPTALGNFAANAAQTLVTAIGDAILPGLGQVLGPVVGGLIYKPSMQANDMRDQFIAQNGGLDNLNRRAVEAGTGLGGLLNASNPEKLQRAIEALTRQIEEAEQQRRDDISTLLKETGLADPSLVAAIAGRQGFLGGDAERAALEQFLTSNLGRAGGGFQTFLESGGQVTAENASGFGSGVAAIFGEMVGSGMGNPLEVLKALDPIINGLQQQFVKLGVDGGAAFADIASLAAFAAQEGVGPAIEQVLALNDVMIGLQNVGLLTEETFDALTGTITDTFNKLVAEGKNGDQALRLMQPSLQTIWELQQDFGYSVDEATQKLLDQAAAAGLVGDQFRSSEERMVAALEALVDRLDTVISRFFGIGDAAEDAAQQAQDAWDDVEYPLPPQYPQGGPEIPENDNPGGNPAPYARGGLVRPRYLAWGGPIGSDTVPAWLTPGEFVMRRSAVERIGAGTLQAMNSGGGGATNVTVNISAVDGDSVRRFVQSREFSDALTDAQAKNMYQLRTRSRNALGVVS